MRATIRDQYGVIKWYSKSRKYGFITIPDKDIQDIFFHRSDIRVPAGTEIEEGDTVLFRAESNDKGYHARDIIYA